MSKTLRTRRWTGWSKRQPSLLRPFPVLRVEELEARSVPATFTWTGASTLNANWNNPGNWAGNVAPTGAVANNDLLVFPSGTTVRTTNNNIVNGSFFSITVSDSNYVLAGNAITLGSSTNVGNITVGAGVLNSKIDLNIALGGAVGFYQVNVNNNSNFAINGKISGNAGNDLTKTGIGVLNLTATNSYSGNTLVNAGSMVISNSKALGSTTGNTTVATNAELDLSNVAGTITEPLILNGTGLSNLGALRSIGGANSWAGTIRMDSDVTYGADANTSVNITGVIDDGSVGRNVTKEGLGTVQFSGANTYRGTTTINEGVLAVANAKALGTADRTAATGTVVNHTSLKAGQLQIVGGATGFTVLNERLQLHGDAGGNEDGLGSLYNFTGNNEWAGPVLLGGGASNVTFTSLGAADTTDLIISGVVQGGYLLNKVQPGRIIFNNANTYTNVTNILAGTLNIRDSRALSFQPVTVTNGATLELEVDSGGGYNQTAGVTNPDPLKRRSRGRLRHPRCESAEDRQRHHDRRARRRRRGRAPQPQRHQHRRHRHPDGDTGRGRVRHRCRFGPAARAPHADRGVLDGRLQPHDHRADPRFLRQHRIRAEPREARHRAPHPPGRERLHRHHADRTGLGDDPKQQRARRVHHRLG